MCIFTTGIPKSHFNRNVTCGLYALFSMALPGPVRIYKRTTFYAVGLILNQKIVYRLSFGYNLTRK